MKTLLIRLNKIWFEAMPPERLAILRIATGCYSLWYLLSRFGMLQRMVKNIDSFEPVGILSWMTDPMAPQLFFVLSVALVLLNLLYIIGWKFKTTGPLFAVSMLIFFTYRNSWSMIYHNRNALILHIFILGLVASADALSIDAWNNQRNGGKPKRANWRYGWPVVLICAATVSTYFLSGVAKLAGELAWSWASGAGMRSQVAADALRKSVLGAETSSMFHALYEYTWLFMIMGIITFILELGAPLALVRKKLGIIWSLSTWAMHWGIFFIMGISFRYQITGFIFLSFFPLEKLVTNSRTKKSIPTIHNNLLEEDSRPVILFDGLCNLCNHWVQFVINNERNGRFRFASLQSDFGKSVLKSFGVKDDMSTVMLVSDGVLYQKSEAILRMCENLRFPWVIFGLFIIVPSIIRDFVYTLISKNRYSWFGKKQQCAIPTEENRMRFIE